MKATVLNGALVGDGFTDAAAASLQDALQAADWADTRGVALLMAQERGAVIAGLVEDMARVYPKPQQLVGMKQVAVQKDPWHIQRDGSRVRLFLGKAAYRAMGQVIKLEKQLAKAWDKVLFTQHYLLFVLWYNMRPYQRGKRQGQSPYQIAGIAPGCAAWLELLGYPAN